MSEQLGFSPAMAILASNNECKRLYEQGRNHVFALQRGRDQSQYLGKIGMFAVRIGEDLIEGHGFAVDTANRTLTVESHYIRGKDADYDILFSHKVTGTTPDGGCERLLLTPDSLTYTQLHTGRAWPMVAGPDGPYERLHNRLRIINPDRSSAWLATKSHRVYRVLRQLTEVHGHRVENPLLEAEMINVVWANRKSRRRQAASR